MEKDRIILADEQDVKEMMMSDIELEMDEQHFYMLSNLFGDEPSYMAWDRQMQIILPGKLHSPAMYYPDLHGVLRQELLPYVLGLKYCVLDVHVGDLLPEKRDGKPVFLMKRSLDETEHAIVVIRWAVDHPPQYDIALDSNFALHFGICKIKRMMPGTTGTPESYGTDVLVMRRHALGKAFEEQLRQIEQQQRCMFNQEWRLFEVQRDYYRAKIEGLQDAVSKIHMRLDFMEDFAWLSVTDAKVARRMSNKGVMGRCWYNEVGLQKLKTAIAFISPAYSMVDFFSGLAEVLDDLQG